MLCVYNGIEAIIILCSSIEKQYYKKLAGDMQEFQQCAVGHWGGYVKHFHRAHIDFRNNDKSFAYWTKNGAEQTQYYNI